MDNEGVATPTWQQRSEEQQHVLYAAATAALLPDLLALWEPALDWDQRLAHVPRLANAIIDLQRSGLIELYQASNTATESVLVEAEAVPALAHDPAHWMTDEGPTILVELALTDAAAPTAEIRVPCRTSRPGPIPPEPNHKTTSDTRH